MRVTAVIQARAGSTRLPGKVLAPLGARPVLGWVVRAALAAREVDSVVVATSTASQDDAVEALARDLGVAVVRGSEDDVLARFALALREHGGDAVVRLTADCPMLDPALVDDVVRLWRAHPDLDYVATTLVRTLPRGLDVELVSAGALRRLDRTAQGHDRTHVTSALYAPGASDPRAGIVAGPDSSRFRLTVDEPDDLAMLRGLVDEVGDGPHPWRLLVQALEGRPDLQAVNAHVRQKGLHEG